MGYSLYTAELFKYFSSLEHYLGCYKRMTYTNINIHSVR